MLTGYAEMTKIKTNPPKCEYKTWHQRPGFQICLRGYLHGLSFGFPRIFRGAPTALKDVTSNLTQTVCFKTHLYRCVKPESQVSQ